jgi:condensin complex subunit 2
MQIIGHFFPELDILEDKVIAHSLADFSFTHDNITLNDTTLYRDDSHVDDGDGDGNAPAFDAFGDSNAMVVDGGGLPHTEDFFQGDQGVDDDYAGGGAFGGDDYGSGHDGSPGVDGQQAQNRPGAFVPFDPRRIPTERNLVMAMTEADGDSSIMGYFDQNIMKNWAGPEHWKLRKVIRKRKL